MTSEYLPVFVQNALEENEELLPTIRGGKLRQQDILSFCQNFRIAGTGGLLLGAKPESFRWNLHQSGRAYVHFLKGTAPEATLTSKALPFFDAIAAGDFEGAEEIARHSRRTWAQGEEYEEDFLFVDFCMQHFFLGTPPQACERLLARYETALQGTEDFRLDVCKALLVADSQAFREALGRFLTARSDNFDVLERNESAAPELLATERHLSIEGLALVRLAERKGMETDEDYANIPSIARLGGTLNFKADSWKSI